MFLLLKISYLQIFSGAIIQFVWIAFFPMNSAQEQVGRHLVSQGPGSTMLALSITTGQLA